LNLHPRAEKRRLETKNQKKKKEKCWEAKEALTGREGTEQRNIYDSVTENPKREAKPKICAGLKKEQRMGKKEKQNLANNIKIHGPESWAGRQAFACGRSATHRQVETRIIQV